MPDIEVHIDLKGRLHQVGLVRSNTARGTETVVFEYTPEWLANPDRFSIEPALALTRGTFAPLAGQAIFGSIGDSAPDTWGRRLMQRAERRQANREGRAIRTLSESNYLLGVADETRLGALRFRWMGNPVFQAPTKAGVPALIELGRLLQVTERILRDEETDEDLQLIFAPGSSLGGARPKASVIDQHGHLSIAKFPKETDERHNLPKLSCSNPTKGPPTQTEPYLKRFDIVESNTRCSDCVFLSAVRASSSTQMSAHGDCHQSWT